MIQWAGLPRKALDDPFKPPDDPCIVKCIHCGQEYSSDEIVWCQEGDQGFWCCPKEGCGGTGFGCDIFPLGAWQDDDTEEPEEDGDVGETPG